MLIFSFKEFYTEYSKELRMRGDDIKGFKESTVRDYIIKSPFFVKPTNGRNEFSVKFENTNKWAFKLDVDKMPDHLREIWRVVDDGVGF